MMRTADSKTKEFPKKSRLALRRGLRIAAVALCLTVLAVRTGHTVHAEQAAASLSTSQQILLGYMPPSTALPSDLSPVKPLGLTNTAVAGLVRDPAEVSKIVARGRLEGIMQTFTQAQGPTVTLQLSLFGDAAGAQADLMDPVELAWLEQATAKPLAVSPAASMGDRSESYTATSASSETIATGFTAGRLEVLVSETGALGTVDANDLTPLAALMATQAHTPPPLATAAELAVLQTETGPESILHDAYFWLIAGYIGKPQPATLLGAAYDGAAAAARAAGSDDLPPQPQISDQSPEGAWTQFLSGYQALADQATTVSQRDLADAAATAMYSGLNCHTKFFTPSTYARFADELQGQPAVGTGISLVHFADAPNRFFIQRVLPGSPADAGGLLPGDELQAIDHRMAADAGRAWANPLNGAAGDVVTLTILRPGMPDAFDRTLVLAPVQPVVEQHQILPGGIGYIEFDGFTDGDTVVNRVSNALQDFASAGNVNGWVLDLRFNNGGSEATMARIAGLFVANGSPLVTQTDQSGKQQSVTSIGSPLPDQKPLVILTGPATASAAEIFAESMHDLGRATIVGAKTAGCVNGGQVLGLLDGAGVFVSTQDVHSGPNQVALEGVGITPDESVGYTRADLVKGNDPRLAAAVSLLKATALAPAGS